MRQAFIEKSFYESTRRLIDAANTIATEYANQGYQLTLRQLYYQFVARGLIPNTTQSYKRLGSAVNDGRMAGLIDWDLIEDRTRWLRSIPNYKAPAAFMRAKVPSYAEDLWRTQETYCEVWVEKDALSSVIARPCNELRVPYFPCRGYGSQSELYAGGQRLREKILRSDNFSNIVIFHLGDHDPSGIDMTRDNAERLTLFAGMEVDVRRLALNLDQIEQYNPPPNPAKETDSRFAGYADKFGDESWELDALEPSVIEALVREAILAEMDTDEFNRLLALERANEGRLRNVADRWPDIQRKMAQRRRIVDDFGHEIEFDE